MPVLKNTHLDHPVILIDEFFICGCYKFTLEESGEIIKEVNPSLDLIEECKATYTGLPTSLDEFMALAKHELSGVRLAVAQHPKTPRETLVVLSRDSSFHLFNNIIRNRTDRGRVIVATSLIGLCMVKLWG